MARKLLIETDLVRILNRRIEVSRSIGVFTLRQLTNSWEISLGTMYRYNSPAYRDLSRASARNAYRLEKESKDGSCHRCASLPRMAARASSSFVAGKRSRRFAASHSTSSCSTRWRPCATSGRVGMKCFRLRSPTGQGTRSSSQRQEASTTSSTCSTCRTRTRRLSPSISAHTTTRIRVLHDREQAGPLTRSVPDRAL